ncbi:hypothetical protein [Neotabrizicola sp. sgz301269]|uniref:hypothetical protein n=1 Tax=Neotabrizicola sp. sgz301269 TaxID=3276282 RepID=UPI00377046DC
MTVRPILILTALPLLLSACVTGDGNRALVGAAGGAVAGEVLFDNAVGGAVVGGLAGLACDDLGVRACR